MKEDVNNNKTEGEKLTEGNKFPPMIDAGLQYVCQMDHPSFAISFFLWPSLSYRYVSGVSTLVQIKADPLFLRGSRESLSSPPMDTHHGTVCWKDGRHFDIHQF